MDTCFAVDERSFYDITSEDDLKELWETELDPAMQEALRLQSSDMTTEWYMDSRDIPGVILHDRLMTDAALGTRPIKTEHSYSLASDGDSLPDSPLSHHKMDDMDDECLPAISMKAVCERLLPEDELDIKDEPFSESDSPHSSCPSSPQSHLFNPNEIHLDIEMSNPSIHTTATTTTTATLLKSSPATRIFLTSSPHAIIPQRIQMKIESPSSPSVPFHLPPTPPSCSSGDDSEDNGNVSRPPSPVVRKTAGNRLVLSHHTSTRQPIHTPLISSQPKGSTGTLILTEEEKRTLIAEGYPVPTRLPLTKAEEKSLKKIRRKIKNKISAQESRRKKKEYMDQLERKVEILVSENTDYKKKIENLEDSNNNLLAQLQKLQAIVSRTHPQLVKTIVNN